MSFKIEVESRALDTVEIGDEAEVKIREYISSGKFRGMSPEESLVQATMELLGKGEINFTPLTESDPYIEKVSLSVFEQRTVEDIIGEQK